MALPVVTALLGDRLEDRLEALAQRVWAILDQMSARMLEEASKRRINSGTNTRVCFEGRKGDEGFWW